MHPQTQLDQPDRLLALLGSFWAETYLGAADAERLIRHRAELVSGTFDRLADAADAASRLRCPVYRRERWRHLPVRLSARNSRSLVYGDGRLHGDGVRYADPPAAELTALPAPADLAAVEVICNRLAGASAVLVRGLDFEVGAGELRFRADPFADARFARSPVTEDGVEVDQELDLWLYRPDFDRALVQDHWGYVVGAEGASSPAYKRAVNALYDMLTFGTSARRVVEAAAAAAGLPLGLAGEVVEGVVDDGLHQVVLTDRSAHRLPRATTATVAAGDVLTGGQTLCDGVELIEFNRGALPADLEGLTVGRGLLLGAYVSDLGFPNREVAVATKTVAGRLRVSWELGGHPADVEAFWNSVHARGLAAGTTLAQLLDQRPEPEGEPGPEHLPATMNPLGFLAEHLFRFNLFAVRVRIDALAAGGAGLALLTSAQRLVPPHTCLLLLIDAPPVEDALNHQGEGELDAFDAAEPVEHDLDNGITEAAAIRRVSGQCQ